MKFRRLTGFKLRKTLSKTKQNKQDTFQKSFYKSRCSTIAFLITSTVVVPSRNKNKEPGNQKRTKKKTRSDFRAVYGEIQATARGLKPESQSMGTCTGILFRIRIYSKIIPDPYGTNNKPGSALSVVGFENSTRIEEHRWTNVRA